jgi:hypothetical protein
MCFPCTTRYNLQPSAWYTPGVRLTETGLYSKAEYYDTMAQHSDIFPTTHRDKNEYSNRLQILDQNYPQLL